MDIKHLYIYINHFARSNIAKSSCCGRVLTTQAWMLFLYKKNISEKPQPLVPVVIKPTIEIIEERRSTIKRNPFNVSTLSLLISDLEYCFGRKIILNIHQLRIAPNNSLMLIIKSAFNQQFYYAYSLYHVNLELAFITIIYSGLFYDLDILCTFYSNSLTENYYAHASRLFQVLFGLVAFLWPTLYEYNNFLGILVLLNGKFSRYKTIEASTVRNQIGITSFSDTRNNLMYSYSQCWTYTGTFGLNMYYIVRTELEQYVQKPSKRDESEDEEVDRYF